MALWPNNRRDIVGWSPTRLIAGIYFNQQVSQVSQRQVALFTTFSLTASWPEGSAPGAALVHPLTAGGMSASYYPTITATANLLQGGPMEAGWSATMTANTPSMSLITGMEATWTGTMTANTPSLALTSGMAATWAASLTATANLAMVVPIGPATWAAGMTGAADLKGRLSMDAEFGGAEPLSPQGLAAAVWEALATDYNAAGTMGNKMNSASAAGDPWTADPTSYATGSAGEALVKAAKALKLGEFIALK